MYAINGCGYKNNMEFREKICSEKSKQNQNGCEAESTE